MLGECEMEEENKSIEKQKERKKESRKKKGEKKKRVKNTEKKVKEREIERKRGLKLNEERCQYICVHLIHLHQHKQ
jgi:hypothetical protein